MISSKRKVAYNASYYAANKDSILEKQAVKYRVNKVEVSAAAKEYRDNNKVRIATQRRAKRDARKLEALEYLGNVCSVCGITCHPIAMDFHHTDPHSKEFSLSKLLSRNLDATTFNELDKCIVMCANCHRIHHYNDGHRYDTIKISG